MTAAVLAPTFVEPPAGTEADEASTGTVAVARPPRPTPPPRRPAVGTRPVGRGQRRPERSAEERQAAYTRWQAAMDRRLAELGESYDQVVAAARQSALVSRLPDRDRVLLMEDSVNTEARRQTLSVLDRLELLELEPAYEIGHAFAAAHPEVLPPWAVQILGTPLREIRGSGLKQLRDALKLKALVQEMHRQWYVAQCDALGYQSEVYLPDLLLNPIVGLEHDELVLARLLMEAAWYALVAFPFYSEFYDAHEATFEAGLVQEWTDWLDSLGENGVMGLFTIHDSLRLRGALDRAGSLAERIENVTGPVPDDGAEPATDTDKTEAAA